jgi:hypothetical protein
MAAALIAFSATLLWSVTSAAVTIVTDTRWVQAHSCNLPPSSTCITEQGYVLDGPPLFDDSVISTNDVGHSGTASQTSLVLPGGVTATGSIITAFPIGTDDLYGNAFNDLHVTFLVDEATPWAIDVSSTIGIYASSNVVVILRNDDTSQELFYRYHEATFLYGPNQASGVLAPGTYTLTIDSIGHYTNQVDWSFSLVLAEPATIAPLALGLAALAISSRRRR